MKTILLYTILSFCFFQLKGQEATQSLDQPFHQLKVTGNIHLILQPSEVQSLILKAGSNSEELSVEVKDHELILKTKTELSKEPAIEVRLQYLSLARIEVTKGGRIQSADTLRASFLELQAETGGKAELRIVCDSLSARINQGADLILYGKTGVQRVNAYTWGNYLAYDLEATDTFVKAATGAQVKVQAKGILDCNATSKASVGYWNDPEKKHFKTSVGGQVIQLSE